MRLINQIPEIFKNRRQIWEGLKNNLIKDEHVEQVYQVRLDICKSCKLYDTSGDGCSLPGTQPCCNYKLSEEYNGNITAGCGCSLSVKLRSLSTDCPLGKWTKIMSDQDEELVKKSLNKREG